MILDYDIPLNQKDFNLVNDYQMTNATLETPIAQQQVQPINKAEPVMTGGDSLNRNRK